MSKADIIRDVESAFAKTGGATESHTAKLLEDAHVPMPDAAVDRLAETGETKGGSPLDRLLSRARETNSDAVYITKNGELVGSWTFDKPETLIHARSITKSMTGLAIGKLVEAGKLQIDQPVHDVYTEWMAGPKQDVTIRHLLNHTSGLPFEGKKEGFYSSLETELVTEPGKKFEYSNAGTDVLSGIVQDVSRKRLDQFVADEIFTPLGIKDYTWRVDSTGYALGSKGLNARAVDLAKVGEMMANDGQWNGKNVIPKEWIDESTKPSQPFLKHAGLLWWLDGARFKSDADGVSHFVGLDGFSMRGKKGQYTIVYPKEGLVGVRLITDESYKGQSDEFLDFPKLVKRLKD